MPTDIGNIEVAQGRFLDFCLRFPYKVKIFKSVDYVKYEGQVRLQHLLFTQFSRFQAVVLLNKTVINHRFFFNLVLGEWMDLRNSDGIEFRNFYLTTVFELF